MCIAIILKKNLYIQHEYICIYSIYVLAHIYMNKYIRIKIYANVHIYIYIHIPRYLYACICSYVYLYIHIPLSRTTCPAGGDGRKPKRGTNSIELVYMYDTGVLEKYSFHKK